MIQSFQEYLVEKRIPDKLFKLIHNLDMVPVSSSECERGFSQMNLTEIPLRSSLLTKTTSVIFIKIVGPPLSQFDPTKFVESWLLFGHHHSAIDTKIKERN
jgi:hypothetical protein